jgi:hypothetical protein
MVAPQRILDLVETFRSEQDRIKSQYTEEDIKINFINPFFEALGWDVGNKSNKPPSQRDVRFEYTFKADGEIQRPDYSFCLNSDKKFFMDAKKPSVNIERGISPAYQVKRYGFSKTHPLSIVTDFEEFAVYDCSIRPSKNDKPEKSRLFIIKYDEYKEEWDKIASLFSKDAVKNGSLDSIPQPTKNRVDDELLKDISGWRKCLAENIFKRNPDIDSRSLNYAVQMTIDRILFLRICEDRSIEDSDGLKKLLDSGNIYSRMLELFDKADKKYNSGLFYFHPERGRNNFDSITPSIKIEDKVLENIIKGLYYPDSPYVFSEIPADILGHVYEQFLGEVIQIKEDHTVSVEKKPAVRKAGGVYYTPSYIVDYIVKNTVGKLLEGKTPKEASDLHILDPACGSGSFLIVAYQCLLDWHLEWYKNNLVPMLEKGEKATSKAVQDLLPSPIDKPVKTVRSKRIWERASIVTLPIEERDEEWYLKTAEKKRILLNSICGVDIDTQAVEVTKLSLLLKVLEGENKATIPDLGMYSDERALPDLGNNIKCGNSLIGPDFYDRQTTLLDEEEMYRVNAFDWEAEFPEIMRWGGFDAVIGNPPWGAEYNQEEKGYLRKKYEHVHVRTPESFNYFVDKMWNCTKQLGVVGLIIPSSFLNQYEFWKTRKHLVESASIYRVCNLGNGIFQKVTAPCCIIVFMAKTYTNHAIYLDLRKSDRADLFSDLLKERNGLDASQIGLDSDSYLFQIRNDATLIQKCYTWPTLKDIAEDVATGVSSGLDVAYVYKPDDIKRLHLECELLRKLIIGGEIDRYSLTPKSGKRLIYVTPETKIENFPNCYSALHPHHDRLKKRREAANGKIPWFSLNWPRRTKLFDKPKILIRQTSDRIRAAFDSEQWYCLKSAIVVQLKGDSKIVYEYLLALLNSKLMNYLYDYQVGEQSRVFPEVKPVQLFKLPIRTIDFSDPTDVARHDQMVRLVDRMLDLNKQLQECNTPHEKTFIQNQIDYTDGQIDDLVYELYDLTEEEIRIVKDSIK